MTFRVLLLAGISSFRGGSSAATHPELEEVQVPEKSDKVKYVLPFSNSRVLLFRFAPLVEGVGAFSFGSLFSSVTK